MKKGPEKGHVFFKLPEGSRGQEQISFTREGLLESKIKTLDYQIQYAEKKGQGATASAIPDLCMLRLNWITERLRLAEISPQSLLAGIESLEEDCSEVLQTAYQARTQAAKDEQTERFYELADDLRVCADALVQLNARLKRDKQPLVCPVICPLGEEKAFLIQGDGMSESACFAHCRLEKVTFVDMELLDEKMFLQAELSECTFSEGTTYSLKYLSYADSVEDCTFSLKDAVECDALWENDEQVSEEAARQIAERIISVEKRIVMARVMAREEALITLQQELQDAGNMATAYFDDAQSERVRGKVLEEELEEQKARLDEKDAEISDLKRRLQESREQTDMNGLSNRLGALMVTPPMVTVSCESLSAPAYNRGEEEQRKKEKEKKSGGVLSLFSSSRKATSSCFTADKTREVGEPSLIGASCHSLSTAGAQVNMAFSTTTLADYGSIQQTSIITPTAEKERGQEEKRKEKAKKKAKKKACYS